VKEQLKNDAKGPDWAPMVTRFQSPILIRSWLQVATSVIPLLLFGSLAMRSLAQDTNWTFALALLTSVFLPRVFLIQHDCGHGSFFKAKWANDVVGSLCGVLTFTPYYYWRKTHAIHHASSGNLTRRGIGDVYTMTVAEFLRLSRWGRFKYRCYRHPLLFFLVGPMYLFLLQFRVPLAESRNWKKERSSVWFTNVGIGTLLFGVHGQYGTEGLLLLFQIGVVAAPIAVWLFYVQHQFESVYWSRDGEWDYKRAALEGSSFYDLPAILHWFTANIGFHHIHHLSPRIPNYRLQSCHEGNPELQNVPRLTLLTSLRTISLSLWDEEQQKMVGFPEVGSAVWME
jgi:acyl-lipid omega-6 desaturase (Delta-12 desaturase)